MGVSISFWRDVEAADGGGKGSGRWPASLRQAGSPLRALPCIPRPSRAVEAFVPILVLGLSVTPLVAATPSTLFAQGLGDAARKEQERRKKAAEPGVQARKISDEELKAGAAGGRGTFSGGGEVAPSNATAEDDTASRKAVCRSVEDSPRIG